MSDRSEKFKELEKRDPVVAAFQNTVVEFTRDSHAENAFVTVRLSGLVYVSRDGRQDVCTHLSNCVITGDAADFC